MALSLLNILCLSREYEASYSQMRNANPKLILKLTGCKKPCYYKKYSYFGEQVETLMNRNGHFIFSFISYSNDTRMETETLIYPLSSLVAEFGGVLGKIFEMLT